jgi:phosphoglycolate phosphatase
VIRNIIFRWSGTLVDDLPAVLEATNLVLRQAGFQRCRGKKFRAEFRLPFRDSTINTRRMFPSPSSKNGFTGTSSAFKIRVEPLPHAREFLEFCRESGSAHFRLERVARGTFQRAECPDGIRPVAGPALRPGRGQTRTKIHEMLEENALAAP